MNEVIDGPDPSTEYATVRDPLKLLNVYNVDTAGSSGRAGRHFPGRWLRKGAVVQHPKWAHTTTEAWYDNEWHYFDLDIRGALLRADGVVASLDEARTQRDLWTNPPRKIEPFFPKVATRAGSSISTAPATSTTFTASFRLATRWISSSARARALHAGGGRRAGDGTISTRTTRPRG